MNQKRRPERPSRRIPLFERSRWFLMNSPQAAPPATPIAHKEELHNTEVLEFTSCRNLSCGRLSAVPYPEYLRHIKKSQPLYETACQQFVQQIGDVKYKRSSSTHSTETRTRLRKLNLQNSACSAGGKPFPLPRPTRSRQSDHVHRNLEELDGRLAVNVASVFRQSLEEEKLCRKVYNQTPTNVPPPFERIWPLKYTQSREASTETVDLPPMARKTPLPVPKSEQMIQCMLPAPLTPSRSFGDVAPIFRDYTAKQWTSKGVAIPASSSRCNSRASTGSWYY